MSVTRCGLHRGPLSALRGATPPSRNNLSHANKHRDAALWKKVDFWDLLSFCGTAGGHFRYLATPQDAYFPGSA
jgi:hypothetical protein